MIHIFIVKPSKVFSYICCNYELIIMYTTQSNINLIACLSIDSPQVFFDNHWSSLQVITFSFPVLLSCTSFTSKIIRRSTKIPPFHYYASLCLYGRKNQSEVAKLRPGPQRVFKYEPWNSLYNFSWKSKFSHSHYFNDIKIVKVSNWWRHSIVNHSSSLEISNPIRYLFRVLHLPALDIIGFITIYISIL